jgi:hypothetical protein
MREQFQSFQIRSRSRETSDDKPRTLTSSATVVRTSLELLNLIERHSESVAIPERNSSKREANQTTAPRLARQPPSETQRLKVSMSRDRRLRSDNAPASLSARVLLCSSIIQRVDSFAAKGIKACDSAFAGAFQRLRRCADSLSNRRRTYAATLLEGTLRKSGVTLVFIDRVCAARPKGKRADVLELLQAVVDYDRSGQDRRDLAQKILFAHIRHAREGFSTGGRPAYGFRRWLVKADGTLIRDLQEREHVRMAGHHVVCFPPPKKNWKSSTGF